MLSLCHVSFTFFFSLRHSLSIPKAKPTNAAPPVKKNSRVKVKARFMVYSTSPELCASCVFPSTTEALTVKSVLSLVSSLTKS